MMTKKHWLKKLRMLGRLNAHIRTIREDISVITRHDLHRQNSEQNYQNFIAHVIHLIEVFQELLDSNQKVFELADYEELPPEDVDLCLPELLVLFRRTLVQLQETPPQVQQNAIEILYSYFIELQGLYDLIFVRRYQTSLANLPSSALSAIEDERKRYFRCFQLSEQALLRLKEDGLAEALLGKLETLKSPQLVTEENLLRDLETVLGKDLLGQYKSVILKQTEAMPELLFDPVIQEYQSIPYQDLMNTSIIHHVRVVSRTLGAFLLTALKEYSQGQPRGCRILEPLPRATVETLRAYFLKYPLSKALKLRMALQRHLLRLGDLLVTRLALRLGRPIFELLLIATWCQTVKDHIIPGPHKPSWQAAALDLKQDEVQKVTDDFGSSGTIRMSSAFFMQPRVKFHLERFLIFKNRTMTVGDIVRPTEFGNWMRRNSPDEFLQFFNVALGDMSGFGIRTMPEHEITETTDTLWLYHALMQFVPGGIVSFGSIKMRETNYGLKKAEQLLYDLQFFDPRFKRSSSVFRDLKAMLDNLRVLKKGRIGKALKDTESFAGQKREL